MCSEAPPSKCQKQGQNATGESAVRELAAKADAVVVDLLAANFDATHAGGFPLPPNFGEARKFFRVR